jgi:hypothetical protein
MSKEFDERDERDAAAALARRIGAPLKLASSMQRSPLFSRRRISTIDMKREILWQVRARVINC